MVSPVTLPPRLRPLSPVVLCAAVCVATAVSIPVTAQTDLDAFMRQVVAKRDDNWKKLEQYIFDEESAAAGAPSLSPFGLKMVGPVIMTFGNAAQLRRRQEQSHFPSEFEDLGDGFGGQGTQPHHNGILLER